MPRDRGSRTPWLRRTRALVDHALDSLATVTLHPRAALYQPYRDGTRSPTHDACEALTSEPPESPPTGRQSSSR
jgi:hypothetical protein